MASLNTALFRDVVEPLLNETFDGRYNQYAKEYTEFLDAKPGIKRASHEEPVLYPFGLANVKQQGDPVVMDDGGESGVARYVYVVYALAFSITEELMEDGDHLGILGIYTESLADSLRYTKELVAANVLNNAFSASYPTYDGVALCATNHVTGIAGSQSNTFTNPIALSQAGLEQMDVNIRKAKDGRGKIIALKPTKLLVPPDLVYVAERLTKSVLQSGTANNDINAFKSIRGLEWCQITRLSSATAWFMKTDAPRGLLYLDRRAINTQSLGDFETGNLRYRASMRFAVGATDPLGVFGTAGL